MEVNGAIITLKLDTGAKASQINEFDIRSMKIKHIPHIYPSTILLKAYNGKPVNTRGNIMFLVVPDESLLVDNACENLDLIKRVYHINTKAQSSV